MFDLLVRNALIADGNGGEPCYGDVAVAGDTISAVGNLAAAEASRVIEANGQLLCPGFIDVHSHSDVFALVEPAAPSKIRQGVTTEIVGNCGASAAPLHAGYRLPSDWENKPLPPAWSTLAEYRDRLAAARPAVNLAMLVGHNTLRAGTLGYENRTARPDELAAMKARLAAALDDGAIGFSTGLVYPPGMYAPTGEITELARVTQSHAGVYATHMRSESSHLLEAIDESIAVARDSGVALQISHFKTSGPANWHKLEDAIARIHAARSAGMAVHADRYPYTASNTDLDVILPPWAQEGGRAAILARLAEPAARDRIAAEWSTTKDAAYWDRVQLATVTHPDYRNLRGHTMAEAAEALHCAPADAVLAILRADELTTGAFFFGMSEENLLRIYRQPYVMVGSDASIRAPTGPLSTDYPHPRAYGTFPRFLRLCRDRGLLTVGEAVRRITALPADAFGLRRRGRIERSQYADLVLLDPGTLRDTATYATPAAFPEGISHVIVNGTLTLADGAPTGYHGGRFVSHDE